MIQFYIFFLVPLQISLIHRLTQELTPVGTIISLNMTTAIYAGTYIAKMVLSYFIHGKNDNWLRLIGILIGTVPLIVSFKRLKTENSET